MIQTTVHTAHIHYVQQPSHLSVCVIILNISQSKRLASHYTPVLYFFAIFICITKEIFLDRATELPFCIIIIYPLAVATAAVFILVLIFGVEALSSRSVCVLHMYMSELCCFNSMLDSTLRILLQKIKGGMGGSSYISGGCAMVHLLRMYIYKDWWLQWGRRCAS